MKTLSILFSEPNMFYAVIDGVNVRIENPEILPLTSSFDTWFDLTDQRHIQDGDIFQAYGFEYEVETIVCGGPCSEECQEYGCRGNYVAILKLAKEEEPKPVKPLREHFEVDTDAGIFLQTFRYIDALEKYIEQIEKK